MGIFGGFGAGRGWLKFAFLVSPEVLRDALAATKPVLVITNSRVLAEYEATPIDEYIGAYSRYMEAMLESPEAAQGASMGTYIGLAASLASFSTKSCPDARYKLMIQEEPVVSLAPLTLYYDAPRGQLRTHVASKLYFGIELAFPRVVSLDRDKHEILYETQDFPSYGIFESVKSWLHKATSPCKIRSQSREHRTPIRIAKDLKDRMKRHPGLIAAGLELV